MRQHKSATAAPRAAYDDKAGRAFLIWIGAFALLVLSLFAFGGAREAAAKHVAGGTEQPRQVVLDQARPGPGQSGTLGRPY